MILWKTFLKLFTIDHRLLDLVLFSIYDIKTCIEIQKGSFGGQGGDEIFGGYTRYLIAYFEQCIKSAIDGTTNNGNFVVTYESII